LAFQIGVSISNEQQNYLKSNNISPSKVMQKVLTTMIARDSMDWENEIDRLQKEVDKWKDIAQELQQELLKSTGGE